MPKPTNFNLRTSVKKLVLPSSRKREKIGLAVEVRNRKNKICKGEAEKFIQATELCKKQYKLTKVVAILISCCSFSKSVLPMFGKHSIIAANIEDFGLAA